jgi:hypothetical protein
MHRPISPLSFEQAMSKGSTKIPIEAYNQMDEKVSEMKEIFETKVQITEEDMDSAGILNIDLSKS